MDTLGGMTSFLDPAHILREDLTDNRHERIKIRAGWWTFPAVSRRN